MNLSKKVKNFIVCLSVAPLLISVRAENMPQGAVALAGQSCAEDKETEEKTKTCDSPALISDQKIAEIAVGMCLPGVSAAYEKKAIKNALILLSVEREMNVPEVMRGMTLAAACKESGFSASAEGDHKYSKDGKTPKAIGIFQMWPFYERAYKTDRRDVTSSARGWLKHIARQVPYVAKSCHTTTIEDNWRVAWVTGVRAPKKGGRCKENTSHWNFFKKVRAEVESDKSKEDNKEKRQRNEA